MLKRPDATLINLQQAALDKYGVVAERANGSNFLLAWVRRRRDEVYVDTIAGNYEFWTLEEIPNKEIINEAEQSYIVRGSNSLGNGFNLVECQKYQIS